MIDRSIDIDTLVKTVHEKLDVKIGDLIVYVEDDKGNIILQTSKIQA